MASDAGRVVAPEGGRVRYSLVYMIHGDGEYTYHDSIGVSHRADEEAFSGALLVGERSADAEVFIFYQKPKSHFLFSSKDDGDFRYFRRGKLLVTASYSRDDSDLKDEVDLFRRYTVGGERTFFLYYGHEIPEAGGDYYDESGTGRRFNIASLGRALENLATSEATPPHTIDLLVLSTCFNGSPCAISRLAPYAQYIIASPEYLHLSYMNNRLFESLDSLDRMSTADIARRFAKLSFERLEKNTETAITVVLYDTRKVGPFLNGTRSQCDSLLNLLRTGDEPAVIQYYDWMDNVGLYRKGVDDGVTVFYRPPEFGRMQNKKHHSGWEAWRVNGSEELRVKSEEAGAKKGGE
jgi:hypothetical protein